MNWKAFSSWIESTRKINSNKIENDKSKIFEKRNSLFRISTVYSKKAFPYLYFFKFSLRFLQIVLSFPKMNDGVSWKSNSLENVGKTFFWK